MPVRIELLKGPIYRSPSSIIDGIVHIPLIEAANIRSLEIVTTGRAITEWMVNEKTETFIHSESPCLFSESVVEDPSQKKFSKDEEQQIPFTIALTPKCLSSYEGAYGFIRYDTFVKIRDKLGVESKTSIDFKVVHLSTPLPEDLQPIWTEESKKMGSGLFHKGTVTVKFRLMKSCFSPGEELVFDLHVDNGSNSTVLYCVIDLVQDSDFTTVYVDEANPERQLISHKSYSKDIEGMNAVTIVKKKDELSFQVPFKIPESATPSISEHSCSLIQINYRLRIELHMKDSKDTLTIFLPIRIVEAPSVEEAVALGPEPLTAPSKSQSVYLAGDVKQAGYEFAVPETATSSKTGKLSERF